MRRPVAPIVFFVCLLSIFAIANAGDQPADSAKAIWIVDDFEDGDIMGWATPSGPCTAAIAAPGASSSFCMGVNGACGHYGGTFYDIGGFAATGVSLSVRPSGPGANHLYVVLDDDDNSVNGYIIAFFANDSGWFSVWGDLGTQYLLMPNDDLDWHSLQFDIDWVGKNVDVVMDGQYRQYNVPFDDDTISTIRRMHLYNFDMASAWYDTVEMATPPPSLTVMTDDFESADDSGWSSSVPAMPKRLVLYAAPGIDGAIGGRSGADVACGQAAQGMAGVPLHATTRAFISVSAGDEIADMPARYGVPTNRIITGPNQEKIADDWADLLDGTIDMTLLAAGVMGMNNWYSGSQADGTVDADTCGGWTVGSGSSGRYGYHGTTTSGWISSGDGVCGNELTRILCLAWR